VQKLEDGKPLGGRVSAVSAFGESSGGYTPNSAQIDPITGAPLSGGVMGI
jgi:hypothetical protein